MTIRDPEVLELLRDEPELLAIADAVGQTQRLARTSRRRTLSRSAVLVAVGAVAVVVAMLWPGGGGRNPILDRALAAIGDGRVLHLVVRVPTGQELVNLKTDRTVVPTEEIESWSDRSSKRFHLIFRENGRILGEALLPQDGGGTPRGTSPALAALWTGYRQALADGKAKIESSGTLYGRSVYWLSFPPASGGLVAIDRNTYEPVAFRSTFPDGHHVDYRILLARTEPFSSEAFRRRTPKQSQVPSSSSSHGSGVLPSKPFTLAKPWFRAGATVAGLRLSSARPIFETSGGKTTRGAQLVYGPENGPRNLTIQELLRPGDASEWSGIPKGYVRIVAGSESERGGKVHTLWTGNLVDHGIYVTIETGVSRAAVLEAARALRPA